MKGALATEKNCVLRGWRSLNQFDIVSETPYSCDTGGCELLRVILCSLLCPKTDWKIRVGKQGKVMCFKTRYKLIDGMILFNLYFIDVVFARFPPC